MRQTDFSSLEDTSAGSDSLLGFARSAGLGLTEFVPEDLLGGNLSLVFALSAWLRMNDIDISEGCAILFGLRRALVEVSGLDASSEPIPLMAGDSRTALVGLGAYMHGLIRRAAARARRPAQLVVEEAVALLQ